MDTFSWKHKYTEIEKWEVALDIARRFLRDYRSGGGFVNRLGWEDASILREYNALKTLDAKMAQKAIIAVQES